MDVLNSLLDVQSGPVIVNEKPYYYVDKIHGPDGDLIVAYELSKSGLRKYEQNKNPLTLGKAYKIDDIVYKKYDSTSKNASPLVKLLSKRKNNVTMHSKIYYKPAIFVSYVEDGTDSITETYGQGFKEMHAVKVVGPVTNKYEEMKPTGVFIGLNNVKWLKDVYDFSRWQGYLVPIYSHYLPYFKMLNEMGRI